MGKIRKKLLRQQVLRDALKILREPQPFDGASQPVVDVLLGDVNLNKDDVEEALQELQPLTNDFCKLWHVHTTTAALNRDLVIVRGANALRVISWNSTHALRKNK